MAMMNVGKVRVIVAERNMWMIVDMRLLTVPCKVVLVLMMLVMRMAVRVLHWLMQVRMGVVFGQVQGNALRH